MFRPSHWDMVADDPQRAITFYGNVFGWTFQKWEGPVPYWMFITGTDGAGINGGMGPRRSPEEVSSNVVDVPDVDATIAKVVENGGTVIVPKSAIPGVGWIAYFHDTERNQFGIMQSDPDAK